jgi:hypothetical protein
MARKRKNRRRSKRAPARAVFPGVLAGLLVPAMVMALCYLWVGTRCEVLGQEIQQLEDQKLELGKRLTVEQNRWANLLSPASFDRVLQRHGLRMSRPSENRIVRISSADDGHRVARAEPPGSRTFYE